ncbi:MAG: glycosyltransferase family 1 protein [Ilyomonas sp.]
MNPSFTKSLSSSNTLDLVCFSHLRWNFVFQRPQHLLSRAAKTFRVFYIEETEYFAPTDSYKINLSEEGVWIVSLYLNDDGTSPDKLLRQKNLLNALFLKMNIHNYFFWYYTPMPIRYTTHFQPKAIVYDCMDELSNFKNPPVGLRDYEAQLMSKADVVFTGGYSLYEAKKHKHHNIHPFPSSIDIEHFAVARNIKNDPNDQAAIPHPRIGFYGVIDERFNLKMIEEVARKKQEWQIILIGPICKIEKDLIPNYKNVHYLGSKTYQQLPNYLSGWDIAMIPFELNESTKYISPTKTPEYLAAGKPVISTSIRDVVKPYNEKNLVYIADTADEFIKAAEKELSIKHKSQWLEKVDAFLCNNSWDITWNKMLQHINDLLSKQPINFKTDKKEKVYV